MSLQDLSMHNLKARGGGIKSVYIDRKKIIFQYNVKKNSLDNDWPHLTIDQSQYAAWCKWNYLDHYQ